jgi:hypothetical protein
MFMGFYVRRSIKSGPFRFNLSKSGLGVSAGVPGFRIGTGPRGNYVNLGAGGVYYRSTSRHPRLPSPAANPPPIRPFSASHILMEDVTGATAVELEPTGNGDVVEQLNSAARYRGWAWPATITALIIGLLFMPWGLIIWAAAAPFCYWLFLHDASKRSVVLFYDVSDSPAAWFDDLVGSWSHLSDSQKLWRVVEAGQVRGAYQHKTNAGAGSLVTRVPVVASLAGTKHISTNVAVPTLVAGKSSIHFMPDRLIVRDGGHYTDIAYQHLWSEGSRTQFIESVGGVVRDSRQVGETWQYVNVKGGPDRRFANNRILPVVLYGVLNLTTNQGFSWRVQTSREHAGEAIAPVLQHNPLGH